MSQKNFVSPDTEFYTQAIERAWQEGRAMWKRNLYPGRRLQSHLDEVSRRLLHKDKRSNPVQLMEAFFKDIVRLYDATLGVLWLRDQDPVV